jgi:hypothetical protein
MVFQKIECLCGSVQLDGYKSIHLALVATTFIGKLHLWWVPVRGPTLRSLYIPLIIIIGIATREREREITYTQTLQVDSGLTCLQGLAPSTFCQVLAMFTVFNILSLQPILSMQLRSINICILSNS